jgi:hypothetical protein
MLKGTRSPYWSCWGTPQSSRMHRPTRAVVPFSTVGPVYSVPSTSQPEVGWLIENAAHLYDVRRTVTESSVVA